MNKSRKFLQAAKSGNLKIIRELVSETGFDPDQTNQFGETALVISAYYGQKEVVSELLNNPKVNPMKMAGLH